MRLKRLAVRIQDRESQDDLEARLINGGSIANIEELQNANRLYGRLSMAMERPKKQNDVSKLDDLKARRNVVSKAITAFRKEHNVTRRGKMAARLLPERRAFAEHQEAALNAIKGMRAPFEAVVEAALDGASE